MTIAGRLAQIEAALDAAESSRISDDMRLALHAVRTKLDEAQFLAADERAAAKQKPKVVSVEVGDAAMKNIKS